MTALSLTHLHSGERLVVSFVEKFDVVIELFDGVVEDGLGLVELHHINEVFVVEVHGVDALHDAVHLLLLARLALFLYVALLHDDALVALFVFLAAWHSNQI